MQDPREVHQKYVKRIVFYIKGTAHLGIKYCQSLDFLVIFIEFDWIASNHDQNSTSGYVFCFSTEMLVWSCKKHKVLSLLTTKAKYRGTVHEGT
jgi:hypothetical protein